MLDAPGPYFSYLFCSRKPLANRDTDGDFSAASLGGLKVGLGGFEGRLVDLKIRLEGFDAVPNRGFAVLGHKNGQIGRKKAVIN